MTPPADDGEPAGRNRLRGSLRASGMVSALGLGAVAVWLIVTSESVKGTRIGALIGFWALLFAAFAMFGTRRPAPGLDRVQDEQSGPGGELSRVEDAAARREYEYRLMEMLRREITATMSAELLTLRADVSALRSELVEKVGSQIRLERIETTRVIGSDIEALQHEERQLTMGGRQLEQLASFSLGSTHTALVTPAVQTSEPLVPEPLLPEPERVPPKPGPPQRPVPLPPEPIAPEPVPPAPVLTEAAPLPGQSSPLPPMPEPARSDDGFASLPRLQPFTDYELDPVEPEGDDPNATPVAGPRSTGGGRRRAADGDNDVLARILSREALH